MNRRSLVVALAVAVVLALSAGACGSGERPGEVVEIVVPAGTMDRLNAGENVDVMPRRLELRVGDTILIRNDDKWPHDVGPYRVGANTELQLKYQAAGEFEGECPLSEGDRYEIIVRV